jgi:hypothetical protein
MCASGNHARAAGSLATTTCVVVLARNAARARSAMRTPSMVASPLGCPPKRRAAPPARRAPTQRSREPVSLRCAVRAARPPSPAPA